MGRQRGTGVRRPGYLTASQLAAVAGLSRARVGQLIRDGVIPVDRSVNTRTVWVSQSAAEAFLETRRRGALAPWTLADMRLVLEQFTALLAKHRDVIEEMHTMLGALQWARHLNAADRQRVLELGETRAAQEPHELFGLNPRFPHPPG